MKQSPPCKPLVGLVKGGFRGVPERAGVYVVFWAKNGKPVAIPRIRCLDEKGVLYIGSAKNLRQRVRNLWTSIKVARRFGVRKKYPHTFVVSLVYTGLLDTIADQELCFYFKAFDEQNARHQEKAALFEYTRRYGEPPPLNLSIGRAYFMVLGLGVLGKSRLASKLDPELREALGL